MGIASGSASALRHSRRPGGPVARQAHPRTRPPRIPATSASRSARPAASSRSAAAAAASSSLLSSRHFARCRASPVIPAAASGQPATDYRAYVLVSPVCTNYGTAPGLRLTGWAALRAAPGQHSTRPSPVAGRRVTLTGSDDASPARAGSATENWSQTRKDSSQGQWGAQPGQAPPGMLKGPRSRAAAAKPPASRRPFLPGSWVPCRPQCPRRPAVPWPDTSSAAATAATMSREAAAQPATAVRKLASSSRKLMTVRVRPLLSDGVRPDVTAGMGGVRALSCWSCSAMRGQWPTGLGVRLPC